MKKKELKHCIRELESEEKHTCDRCGDEIKGWTKTSFLNYLNKYSKPLEVEMVTVKTEDERMIVDVHGCGKISHCKENRKTIHLCSKCGKEFERFMRNEN